jgi:hypothetical protein
VVELLLFVVVVIIIKVPWEGFGASIYCCCCFPRVEVVMAFLVLLEAGPWKPKLRELELSLGLSPDSAMLTMAIFFPFIMCECYMGWEVIGRTCYCLIMLCYNWSCYC